MKFVNILNEIKKREDYNIIMKKKRYFIIKNDEIIGKKLGYEKLENAIDIILNLTSKSYEKGDYYKKKEAINRETKIWKKRNNIKEKPKKKYGFYEQ